MESDPLKKTEIMKKIIIIKAFIFCLLQLTAQEQKSAAVMGIYTQGVRVSPSMAQSLLRIELTKTNYYNVLDNQDMLEVVSKNGIDMSNCYGKECLGNAGKAAGVDKVFTGSIENLGKKIVVTVKILDVASNKYDKTAIQEYVNLDTEIQLMMQMTLNQALGIDNDKELMETLVYYNEPPQTPQAYIKNSGPRMGATFVGGDLNKVLTAPESEGGYDVVPVFSQFGYQFEGAYLSAGNFQALVEGMVLFTGVEQNLFNPSFTFMNGFRSSKNGWEVGFGPTFHFTKKARGYYDDNNNWHLQSDWVHSATYYDSIQGQYVYEQYENPYDIVERVDKRGDVRLEAGWVWAIGKTFHSGYLNIPVNAYFSHNKNGWQTGLSVGFNIAKKD